MPRRTVEVVARLDETIKSVGESTINTIDSVTSGDLPGEITDSRKRAFGLVALGAVVAVGFFGVHAIDDASGVGVNPLNYPIALTEYSNR